MASTYLSRAATGSVTSDKTFTFSHWIKRAGGLGSTQYFFMHENASSHAQKLGFDFTTANKIRMSWWDGSNEYNLDTKRLFRDTSGWYNFVFRFDSTQSTASDRVRFYVNGQLEEITNANGSSPTYPGQNATMNLGQKIMAHGRYQSSSPGSYFDGSLSHIHYCDGQSYAPTEFGETDSTTGEWKIKTSPSVSYGNNGYFILKDGNRVVNDAGNSSGNFSVSGGTLTKTEDCPSNVFATLNVLERLGSNITVSNGNTQFFNQASDWRTIISNLAFPNTGKFYAEMQVNEVSSAVQVGIMAQSSFVGHYQADLGTQGAYNSYAYMNTGQKRTNNSASNYGGSFSGGIIGIAVDMDNKNMYFSKDGVWQNSGNPESGATGTGAAFTDLQIDKNYCFAVASQGSNPKVSWNFGNGYFGTTAVSSAGTNASGIGIFEYDVPTGYTALSTKGLNL